MVNTVVIYDHVSGVYNPNLSESVHVSGISFSFYPLYPPPPPLTHQIHPEPSYADCAVCLSVFLVNNQFVRTCEYRSDLCLLSPAAHAHAYVILSYVFEIPSA